MFCPECGTKNPDNAVFCQECGQKIEVEAVNIGTSPQMQMQQNYVQSQPLPQQAVNPMSKVRKIILVESVLLIMAIICLSYLSKKQFSPEKVAENHFLKVMNGDWEGVYDDIDIIPSKFLSKSNFLEAQKERGSTIVNTYNVEKAENDNSGLGATVLIPYREKGDTENQEYSINLNKQSEKAWGLFDLWKVDPSIYISDDYSIMVPTGTKVVFDGVELDSSYLNSGEDGFDSYVIPQVFKGDYEIKLSQENMEDITTTVSTSDSSYYLDSMTLKEEVKKELITNAQEMMKSVYGAAFTSATFDQIAELFSSDETVREYMESQYSNLLNRIASSDGIGLQQVNFSNMNGSAVSQSNYGVMGVSVTINYDYDCTYGQSDLWTGAVTAGTSSNNGSDEFTFILENGKWVITSASINNLYY